MKLELPSRLRHVLYCHVLSTTILFSVSLPKSYANSPVAGKVPAATAEISSKPVSDTAKVMKSFSPVTVVATRAPQTVQNVPLAVTVVPQEQYKNNRGYGLDEALTLVPGALVQSRSGNQDVRVMIRGFGARGAGERSNAGTTRGLRFLLDGLPLTEPDGRTALDLIDLASTTNIEVIRSNTSALWGNASGGVISLSTVPVVSGSYADVQNSIGSFGYSKQNISAASSFGQSTMYCSMSNTNYDGWRVHSGSSTFQALVGLHTKLAPGTTLGISALAASNIFRIPGPLTQKQYELDAQMAQSDTTVYSPTYTQRDERRFNRVGRIGMSIDHALAEEHSLHCALYAEPKYLQRSERNTFRDFNRYHVGGNAIYHYDADWSSSLSSKLQVGVDEQYQDGAILFYNLDPVTKGRGTTLRDNKREGAQNLGFFVQEQLSIADKWTLLVGGRYDNITYYSYSFINPKLNDERSFTQFSPKLGLNYALSPAMSVYINFSKGVEVPAGNETDPPSALGEDTLRTINSLLQPIKSTTFELGYRHRYHMGEDLFQNLNYSISLYSVTTENDLVPYRGGRFYMPAAKTTRKGVEIGAELQLSNGLSLMASASISDNMLDAYKFDSLYVNSTLSGHTLDLSGNPMPGVPGMFATARLQYIPAFLRQLTAQFELRHVGQYSVNDVNTMQAAAYTIFDASLSYDQPLFSSVSLRALTRMNNLSDARYISSVWINPDLAAGDKSPVYIEPGLARNFVFSVGLHYAW